MTKTAPPVPPANRSSKGTGESDRPADAKIPNAKDEPNPDQKGQQANTKQNTTHQGYQQDR